MKRPIISITLMSTLFISTLVLANASKVNACHRLNPFCSSKPPSLPSGPSPAEIQAEKELREEAARRREAEAEAARAAQAEADRVAKAEADERAAVEKAKAEERAEAERLAQAEASRKAAQAEADRNNLIQEGISVFGRFLFPAKK
jgi:glycerol-3-phosphate dehydrogenase